MNILYALYNSHEQENDVTTEIRGNQIGAMQQTPYGLWVSLGGGRGGMQ
jgi:hypothetical protein